MPVSWILWVSTSMSPFLGFASSPRKSPSQQRHICQKFLASPGISLVGFINLKLFITIVFVAKNVVTKEPAHSI